MNEKLQSKRIQSRLRIVQWAAWIDLILLIALLASAFSNQRNFVHVLGPLHGINFLLLVVIVATPALDGLWSWWFPLAVFFTGGAPGALVGEWIIKRRLKSSSVDYNEHTLSEGEVGSVESIASELPDEKGSMLDSHDGRDERKERV